MEIERFLKDWPLLDEVMLGIMMTPPDDRKRPEATADAGSPGGGPVELPVGRAFLVQLAGDCDPAGSAMRGRVEHVRSGEAARFQSLPELATFMLGVLRQVGKP
jgi:hypothetical protein